MNKEYKALKQAVIKKLKRKAFLTTHQDHYTKSVSVFDRDRIYRIVFWIANGESSFKTYNDSDISLRFTEEEQKELFGFMISQDGKINWVTQHQNHGFDLSFKIVDRHIFGGYNDRNWWDNVAPRIFKKHKIREVDGRLYQFN